MDDLAKKIAAAVADPGAVVLSWGCDAEWCDRTGPGVVTIPVP